MVSPRKLSNYTVVGYEAITHDGWRNRVEHCKAEDARAAFSLYDGLFRIIAVFEGHITGLLG